MTSKSIEQRKPQALTQTQSPRLTVVLNDELDQWIKRGAKSSGLAEGAFVRMKLTELCQQAN